MKLGELVFELVVRGSDKKLDDAYKKMKKHQELGNKQAKLEKVLGRELNNKEKAILSNAFAFGKMFTVATAVIGAVTGVVVALDRMAMSMAKNNQEMINFQRQTGLSFSTLNKYASASASVNVNATEQQVAQTLQRVQNNLREIKLGRGDISPFQELAMIGGKPINVWGKTVEQVIEEVREAIKGVDDVSATNIITRMGFSPDDLLMLRMTKKEFDEISNSYFLSAEQREEMYKYSLELKKLHLELEYLYKVFVLQVLRAFHNVSEEMKPFFNGVKNITKALDKLDKSTLKYGFHLKSLFNPFFAIAEVIDKIKGTKLGDEFKKWGDVIKLALNPFLMFFYILEDIAVYFLGGDSVLGDAIEGLKAFASKVKESFNELTSSFSEKFSLSNIIDEFKKLDVVLLSINPILGGITTALHALNKYNELKEKQINEEANPHLSYNTTSNTANINNNLSVFTQQPVSDVLTDISNMGLKAIQMQPIP